jgi:fermentation-respiration switch protein FrsA (DUF1100 family)
VQWVIPDSLIERVLLFPPDGDTIYALFASAASDSAATVIYCHGNGQNINRYWGRVELLWQAGFNVFIFDYAGYGRSTGTPSGDACYADADAALKWCMSGHGIDSTRIAYYGWSLGSFMACHLAADMRPPCALVLESPMASTSAIAQEGAVLAIPGSFVAGADFDNETRIEALGSTPVLIIFGRKDDTAVPERNARVLLDRALSAGVAVESLPVDNAGHSDIPEAMGYEAYRQAVARFINGQ